MPKGGLTDWHRQQRKKQQHKNKEKRIAERDRRVVEQKSAKEVKDEIHRLKRMHKNEETMPHEIRSKLDRLKKELRLVEEQAEKDKAADADKRKSVPAWKAKVQEQQPKFEPLQYPEVSVYYDATLNPFGAPPPGMPMLYHRRGGGRTLNLADAMVPGRPEIVLGGPPAPKHTETTEPQEKSREKSAERERPQKTESKPTIAPKAKEPRKEKKAEQPPADRSKSEKKEKKKTKIVNPEELPSLPQPSAAVKRSRKGRLAADIWASTEEIEYESVAGIGSLEGAVHKVVDQQWLYRDTQGLEQGPFTTAQMMQWVQAGFFPGTTMARPVSGEEFKRLSKTPPFQSMFSEKEEEQMSKKEATRTKEKSVVQDRIAALRLQHQQESQKTDDDGTEEEGVQARIAALRGQMDASNTGQNEPEVKQDSVQARIEALKRQRAAEMDDTGLEQDLVQARIEALKPQRAAEVDDTGPDESEVEQDSVQARIEALKRQRAAEMDDEHQSVSVQDRIAALRTESHATKESAPSETTANAHVSLPPPPPPPPPSAPRLASGEVPAYPVDDYDEEPPAYPAPYPLGAAEDVPYPIAADSADIPYPVDDDYPVSDSYPVGGDYPVTEDYPVVDDYPATGSYPDHDEAAQVAEPPKKKYKADQEVVSLLPSHLQKKRLSSKPSTSRALAPVVVATTLSKRSEKDDLERLMEEVGEA